MGAAVVTGTTATRLERGVDDDILVEVQRQEAKMESWLSSSSGRARPQGASGGRCQTASRAEAGGAASAR